MQSSDRKVCTASQSRFKSARHRPRTVAVTSAIRSSNLPGRQVSTTEPRLTEQTDVVADTVQQLLRDRCNDDSVAVKYEGRRWTWREHLRDASAAGAARLAIADPARPMHIRTLLPNTPDMLTQMAGAGLGGSVWCGITTPRRGDGLLADVRRADCQVLVTDAAHRPLLDGLDLAGIRLIDVSSDEWRRQLDAAGELRPYSEAGQMDTYMMIFTSGTSGNPKAVKVPHFMVLCAGQALAEKFELTPDDTCYMSMPLFHSNALAGGWAPAAVSGAAMVPAKFSASSFLSDIRRYGATYMNYVGKPLAYVLATSELPDDSENPLRVAFGNEASEKDVDEFSRRFDVVVEDGFGSTENGVIVTREPGTPKGSIGKGFPGVAIYHSETATECPVARFDNNGTLLNAE